MYKKIIPTTSIPDLNPRPCVDNSQESVLPFEMTTIEPGDGEIPTRTLSWKPFGFPQPYQSSYNGYRPIPSFTLGGLVLF